MSTPTLDKRSPALPRAFRRLAWSNLAAQAAEQIGLAAAPIVAVVVLGAGTRDTGLLQTAQTLPFLLLSIPAGILADRMSRRRLMAMSEGVRALSLCAILVVALSGHLSVAMLAALGFVGAAGTVAYSVGAPSLVPALVPRAVLGLANGRIELARSIAFAAGPALAGILVTWTGGPAAFAAAAVLSGGATLLLAGIEEPPRVVRPATHPLADLAEGARLVFAHAWLRPILFTQVWFNISFFVIQAVFVPYAVQRLSMSAAEIGVTLGASGFGMVTGALLCPRLSRTLPVGLVVVIGPLSGLLASVLVATTIWLPSPWLAATGFFFLGSGPIVWVISSTTLRQTVTPSAMLGRVSAIIATSGAGARPVGAFAGAVVGGAFGAETCLVLAVVGFAVQALVIVLSPVRRIGVLPQAAG